MRRPQHEHVDGRFCWYIRNQGHNLVLWHLLQPHCFLVGARLTPCLCSVLLHHTDTVGCS
jgi:hypothetical protein